MDLTTLAEFDFTGDFFLGPAGQGLPSTLGDGSRNLLALAQSNKKAFRGLTSVGKGSRVLMQVKNTYGGLSDYVSGSTRIVGSIAANANALTDAGNPFLVGDNGKAIQLIAAGPGGLDLIGFFKYVGAGSGTIWADAGFTIPLNASATFAGTLVYVFGTKIQGSGSIFALIANTLFFNGAGQVTLTGADITGAIASSTLKVLLQRNGSYTDALSGPYAAGLAQPSAPTVGVRVSPGAGFSGLLNSPALSLQIAAIRSVTGARSIRSPTSAVFSVVNGTVRITFPTMQSGGDHWVIFAPFRGFGGVGVHYRVPVMGELQVSESYVASSVVDGIPRSIELEWQDGDLTTEAAWIDDYPPPAGTHCFGLNNITGVGGCYSDASAGPSTTSPGTCIALSLPNFPESYKPTDLLYLPEQIVSLLGRPTDSYLYVGCRNSVHQIQYLGGSPAAVLTTLWPDVGIANPHAWCQVYGIIFAFTSRGGIVTIGPMGQPDSTFSSPVREFTKNWDPLVTTVNWHPDTMQVVICNGTQSVAYCLQSGGWSSPVYHSDFAAGNALSMVQAGNQMRLTLDNKGTHTLYTWNQGNGSTATAMTQWTRQPAPGRNKTIWQIAEEAELDNTVSKLFVSIHRNFRKQTDATASINAASNVLNVATANFFTLADVGSYVLVIGAGAGGAPLLARIGTFVSGTQVQLVDATTVPLSGAAVQNAGTSVSSAALVIGKVIYQRTIARNGNQVFVPKRPRVREARSYSIGLTFTSITGDAQPLSALVFGTADRLARGATT